jgi:hypothetical protein
VRLFLSFLPSLPLLHYFRYEWKDDRSIEIIGIDRDFERGRKTGTKPKQKRSGCNTPEGGDQEQGEEQELKTCRVAKRFQQQQATS